MRIALLSPLFESVPPRLYGGTERVVANLCRGLTEADIEVTLFASGDSYCEGKLVPMVAESLRLHDRMEDAGIHRSRMLARVLERAHEFDLIHNHDDHWMLPLSELVAAPFLTTLHGRLDLDGLGEALAGFPRANYVSISDNQRTPIANHVRWAATIRHGIDCEAFRFQPRPGSYLAFLGRMDMQKRPDLAIRIAKRCGIPLKIAAKIEGRAMQECYDSLKSQIDGRFIEYIGEISETEKQDFLGNALALVFPIDWPEPFGLVMIESLACGTPVLARPVGSVSELLVDGVTGYAAMDVDTLAARARNVAALDRLKCRRWVEEKFSLKRMTEDYIHVYQQLIHSAGGPAARRTARRVGERWTDPNRRDLLHPVERATDRNS